MNDGLDLTIILRTHRDAANIERRSSLTGDPVVNEKIFPLTCGDGLHGRLQIVETLEQLGTGVLRAANGEEINLMHQIHVVADIFLNRFGLAHVAENDLDNVFMTFKTPGVILGCRDLVVTA